MPNFPNPYPTDYEDRVRLARGNVERLEATLVAARETLRRLLAPFADRLT